MLTIAVLGAVEVRRDGRPVVVPAGKSADVLVRLALAAGAPVGAATIIDELWADDATTTGKNTLQSKISQLRRALGDPALITSVPAGYRLHVDAAAIDALRVLDIPGAVAALRRSGDDTGAVAAAAAGLSLFRGDVLPGDGSWLQPYRARLEEVRLALLEQLLAARVDLGAGGEVIGELEALLGAHPLRENLWHTLILALYRNGRQADALAAYTRARTTLVRELGLDPGPELQALERRILRHDETLRATVQPSAALVIGNLPRSAPRIVGRSVDLATVAQRVDEHRLVTIVGPAGVGKTRLATEIAGGVDTPGGVWLVRLDAADATTSLDRLLAETLNLATEAQLLERIAGVATLLVLDNCEHVIDAAAAITERLLHAAPELRVLATSQLPLGVDDEVVYPLSPLPITESVKLFATRAAQLRPQFTLDGDTRAVVEEVCRSLDGLPLAIELAAARVKSLSVHEIARRLDNRFVLLADPTSRRPARRRALAAALGWSYDLLFPDDQRGLWALSCFVGGAPLAAAEHVLAALGVPGTTAVDVIGRLVDRSLVSTDIAPAGDVRYRLLDSVRAFALDKLRAAALLDVACAAHAEWFAAAAARTDATVRGPAQARCLAFVRRERANIAAALAWTADGDPLTGVQIANGFGWAWVVLGDGTAGAARIRNAHQAAPTLADPSDRLVGLLLTGWLEASAGDVGQAESELRGALALAEQSGVPKMTADAQRHIVFLRLMQGLPADGRRLARLSLATYRDLGLEWEQAASMLLGASAAMMLGDLDFATRWADRAVELLTPIGDSWGLVHAEAILGAIAQAAEHYDEAARHLAHAAAASAELGFLGQSAYHLTTLGRVQHLAGKNDTAAITLDRAIEAAVGCGDMRMATTARLHLARVHHDHGADETAIGLLRQVDDWFTSAGGGDGAATARDLLATLTAAEYRQRTNVPSPPSS